MSKEPSISAKLKNLSKMCNNQETRLRSMELHFTLLATLIEANLPEGAPATEDLGRIMESFLQQCMKRGHDVTASLEALQTAVGQQEA